MDLDHADQRILNQAVRLPPGGAIGGWAAARLLGVDQLDGLAADGRTRLPVLLCIGPDHRIRRDPDSELSRDRLPECDVARVDGVPCTTALRTVFDGMRLADGVAEAVVLADQMLHARTISMEQLRSYVAGRAGWRGVIQARAALDLVDGDSRNSWETRMRMVWMLEAGLPRPRCNPPVFDLRGNLLGYPDLLDSEAGTVVEYDGDGHRRANRHDRDNLREERFEEHGLVVTRVTSIDFRHREDLARRMRRTRERGLGRDRNRDRWTLVVPPSWGGVTTDADAALGALLEEMDARWQPFAT